MSQKVQAVIVRAKDAPVETVTIIIPEPAAGEAVVDILTCGVCHTDLHYKLGGIGNDYPYLLGHEATGVVSKIGEGVNNVAVGDRVILNWRAVCGQCRACAKGTPQYCFNTANASQKMTLEDGTELSPPWVLARSPRRLLSLRDSAPRLMKTSTRPPWACWAAA